jgi:hypothetical protein
VQNDENTRACVIKLVNELFICYQHFDSIESLNETIFDNNLHMYLTFINYRKKTSTLYYQQNSPKIFELLIIFAILLPIFPLLANKMV